MRNAALLFVLTLMLQAGPVAAADIAAGEKVFNKCRACHQVGETAKNLVGPRLNGLFGRPAGSIEGFKYSDANRNSGVVWDASVFGTYIRDPRTAMPGNRMAFAGLKEDKEIADLTAFLAQFDADGRKK